MPPVSSREPRYKLVNDDCRKALRKMRSSSVDAVVCDPPYHLTSGKKGVKDSGFMGKKWDGGDVAFDPATWAAILRVLKPGGHLLAFGGSRTFHRIAVGIEDAGFELRDTVMWIYGSGFPKSLDVSKAIDKAAGAERGTSYLPHNNNKIFNEGKGKAAGVDRTPGAVLSYPAVTDAARQWDGYGTALKPAFEPIIVARKPLIGTVAQNVLEFGVGGINIDECRVGGNVEEMLGRSGKPTANKVYSPGIGANQEGIWEPNNSGRWPANVVHDGSDEVLEAFAVHGSKGESKDDSVRLGVGVLKHGGLNGTAARFFYTAKASKADRDFGLDDESDRVLAQSNQTQAQLKSGVPHEVTSEVNTAKVRKNNHPTVKPQALMRWLVRLVTPPDGLVLDPFAGSGSTGVAAAAEGFRFFGMESDTEHGYFPILAARVSAAYDRD